MISNVGLSSFGSLPVQLNPEPSASVSTQGPGTLSLFAETGAFNDVYTWPLCPMPSPMPPFTANWAFKHGPWYVLFFTLYPTSYLTDRDEVVIG